MSSIDIYQLLYSKPHNEHYLKRYIKFIQNIKKLDQQSLNTESHHILPKSSDLFPEYKSFKDFPMNEIKLSYRQHYIAHLILWKAYNGKQAYAFSLMCNRNMTNSRKYEIFKSKLYSDLSTIMKLNNPNKTGEFTKKSWENASPERRIKQSKILSELNKRKIIPKVLTYRICLNCGEIFGKLIFPHSNENFKFCSRSCSAPYNGRASSKLQKGISKPYKEGRTAWNKGIPNLQAKENAIKGIQKSSEKAINRRIVIRDGIRCWSNPGDIDYPATSVAEQAGSISECLS